MSAFLSAYFDDSFLTFQVHVPILKTESSAERQNPNTIAHQLLSNKFAY